MPAWIFARATRVLPSNRVEHGYTGIATYSGPRQVFEVFQTLILRFTVLVFFGDLFPKKIIILNRGF